MSLEDILKHIVHIVENEAYDSQAREYIKNWVNIALEQIQFLYATRYIIFFLGGLDLNRSNIFFNKLMHYNIHFMCQDIVKNGDCSRNKLFGGQNFK